MKYFLTLLLFVMTQANAFSQKTYSVSKDEKTGFLVFKGPITFDDLLAEPTFTWMKKGLASYKPDSNAIIYLRQKLAPYTIITFMGTWCDDSHLLIPQLSKVLQAVSFPKDRHVMYGVDRDKQNGGIESRIYDIKKVPTIIVFRGNHELGRITENVKRNIETDLVQIIESDTDKN